MAFFPNFCYFIRIDSYCIDLVVTSLFGVAVSAVNRSSFRWLKRNFGWFVAFGAYGVEHFSWSSRIKISASSLKTASITLISHQNTSFFLYLFFNSLFIPLKNPYWAINL